MSIGQLKTLIIGCGNIAGGFDVAYRTEARCQIMIEVWISSLLLLTLIQIVVRLTSITIMSCGKFNYLVTLIPWIL